MAQSRVPKKRSMASTRERFSRPYTSLGDQLAEPELTKLKSALSLIEEAVGHADLLRDYGLTGALSEEARIVQRVARAANFPFTVQRTQRAVPYGVHEILVWVENSILEGKSEAFRLMAELVDNLHTKSADRPTPIWPSQIPPEKLRIERKQGRPPATQRAQSAELLFARAAYNYVTAGVVHQREPSRWAIREELDELCIDEGLERLSKFAFSRCIGKFGLKGLMAA